ncbi:FecR family protein [Flavobacterium agrisoli]|uniref:FecR family protein n=1 Tax=Flavobacterium agrisoli TaxID=2793066 RepID=A0A934UIR8_9FLAO|nr:FecR family protein [Flavobacterium agrisoli]MBK0369122.1 FecR family protein [Flavobacterium agrisoli]
MQNRNQYTQVEDFLDDKSFRQWILHNTNSENWERWTVEHPERAKLVEEARICILAMKVDQTPVLQSTVSSALQQTWNRIATKEATLHHTENTRIKIWNAPWFKNTAALFLILLSIAWGFKHFVYTTESETVYEELIIENNEGLVEQTNNSKNPQIITLSDGSSVLLQPESKISYPKIFSTTERKVYLSGEAFFEISKNKKKPFYVFANEVITKVVGTSFRICAFENQPNVEVIVRTGKVKVTSNNENSKTNKEEVTLLPNEAIRFVRQTAKFDKITDITKDVILKQATKNIEQLSFEFTDIPVNQIFKTIEQAYQVEIDFPKEALKNCHLTTSLSDQPLPEKLKIICKSLGNNTTYEMNGNVIIISSEGCN